MRRAHLAKCLVAGLLVWAMAVPAEARRERRSVLDDNASHGQSSLDEAVSNVRRDTGGHVLSAQKHERDRGTTYRIKVLLPNATVRSFDVKAQGRERH